MGKVVLAYSGGLDTTVAIHWLKHQRNLKVIALAVDVGGNRALDEVGERAISAGASGVHILDLRRAFLRNYCFKALRAGARYEGRYLLSAALSRPLISTELVRLATEEGASLVAHGAPPRGNDQFRLECSVAALDPSLQIIAPQREWKMRTRDEVLAYAERHNLEMDAMARDQFTRDVNLWGARASGAVMLDLTAEALEEAHVLTNHPLKGPDAPEDVTIGFNKGEPVRVNGEKLDAVELMEKLNAMAARHGVGRVDMIENNLMGFKNREVYEAPGAEVLHCAHAALERLVLDKSTLNLKLKLADSYAETVYSGLWFSTLREALDAFVNETQEYVSGEVTVRLFKGSALAISGDSEFSTFDKEFELLRETGGSLPEGAAEGMLAVARVLQRTRAFKQRPRL